jgi:predicted transcriptional regulator
MKKTMTLNLTNNEMATLDELSKAKDMSKTAVVRQALRLYETVHSRVVQGDKLLLEDPENKEKTELLLF